MEVDTSIPFDKMRREVKSTLKDNYGGSWSFNSGESGYWSNDAKGFDPDEDYVYCSTTEFHLKQAKSNDNLKKIRDHPDPLVAMLKMEKGRHWHWWYVSDIDKMKLLSQGKNTQITKNHRTYGVWVRYCKERHGESYRSDCFDDIENL